MALEDFTTYTETDPTSEITVTATKISWVNMARDSDSYVYDDKGAAHFNGDFTHLVEAQNTADGNLGVGAFWSVANLVDDFRAIETGGGDYLLCHFYGTGPAIKLREGDGGSVTDDPSINLSNGTLYYCTIDRDEAIGTYGTLTCKIYSDSGRTTLVDTLTLTLNSSKKDFRYVYGFQSFNTGSSSSFNESTGFSQNLDLQEAAGGLIVPQMMMRHNLGLGGLGGGMMQ